MILENYHVIFVDHYLKDQAVEWCRAHYGVGLGSPWSGFTTRYGFLLKFDHKKDLELFKNSDIGLLCLLR